MWIVDLPPMDPLGVVLGAIFLAGIVVFLIVGSGRRWGPYATTSRRDVEQTAREALMGGTVEGYVPHGDLGPSPRDQLKSPLDR